MIHDIELVYSEERGTWNLFVDGEWYKEGDYEQCLSTMENFQYADDEDDYEEPYDEPYYYED